MPCDSIKKLQIVRIDYFKWKKKKKEKKKTLSKKKKSNYSHHSDLAVHFTPSANDGNREEGIEDFSSIIAVDIVDYMWILHSVTNY